MTSTLARLLPALLALSLAGAAAAQQIGAAISSDLNADGRAERFMLLATGAGTVDLFIENTGSGAVRARDIAWIGGIGQEPDLRRAPNGSVLLTSMNEAIGRNRWRMTLTIAYRRGAYRVAGFTYEWYDTIDIADRGICDLNLLTGRGLVRRGDGPERAVRTRQAAIPATAWTDATSIPAACGLSN